MPLVKSSLSMRSFLRGTQVMSIVRPLLTLCRMDFLSQVSCMLPPVYIVDISTEEVHGLCQRQVWSHVLCCSGVRGVYHHYDDASLLTPPRHSRSTPSRMSSQKCFAIRFCAKSSSQPSRGLTILVIPRAFRHSLRR